VNLSQIGKASILMWREKKPTAAPPAHQLPVLPPLAKPLEEKLMVEAPKSSSLVVNDPRGTLLGRSMVFKGDLSGSEDLMIAGQFEGTLNVQGHCLTIGPEGKVKADVQAARVVIHGSVLGNISVRERVEIHKTGHVVGDLLAPGIAIEDGAYFKGKIEIIREEEPEPAGTLVPLRAAESPA
jgi:cytoskeletal protein CcmA (bactofilin family)